MLEFIDKGQSLMHKKLMNVRKLLNSIPINSCFSFEYLLSAMLMSVCQIVNQPFSFSKVHSCILDGEMVGWDIETESYL